jgi:D-alanine--poly(phosphoribitol) ligase subunit 1
MTTRAIADAVARTQARASGPSTGRQPVTPSPLVTRVRATAARRPGARAITGARVSFTYAELDERLVTWAEELRAFAAPTGSSVALVMDDPAFLAPAFLAVRAAALTPLLIDPQMPSVRREAVIAAARPALTMRVRGIPAYEVGRSPARTLPPGTGYLGFTSGTQGPPKGIVSQEQGVLHFVDWEIDTLGVRAGQRIAMISPPTFEVVFREMFVTLCGGGELLAAPARVRADPAAVVPWLAEQDVEVAHAVPSLAARWVEAAPGRRMERLRWTLFAGEPLHARHVRAWREAAPLTEVVNLYGPSETTLAKFWYRVPHDPGAGIQPVGRPLPGTRLHRLTPPDSGEQEHGQEAEGAAEHASFQVGIETRYGSLGYLEGTASPADEAALTRRAGTTMFVSQDLGVLDGNGDLVIRGRLDSRVKRRGVFVDLGGIEEAAARLAGPVLVCCLQREPEAGGTLTLAVEEHDGLSLDALRRGLRRELGPQAPDEVVALPRMPLSPNGKIDRRALAELLSRTAPSARTPTTPTTPRTTVDSRS